jgi:23S rRNA (cytidine1920-2'-O)/16S rRNA (cytidine1409-2'-O)-methyltransferase
MMDLKKTRVDQLLVDRGLADSRSIAQRLILAGNVLLDGQTILQASKKVLPGAALHIKAPPPFVSRGGEKLAGALNDFHLRPAGWVCADVGASTGGFTDCLLQRGASRVYAIDVGKGILDWRLRNDARVIVREGENARYIVALPETVDLITMDASFISLRVLLPVAIRWLKPEGRMLALIKPQFEAGRGQVGKGGVVRDRDVHRRVLVDVFSFAQAIGLILHNATTSPLKGPAGNIEFLAWWDRCGIPSAIDETIERLIPA